MQKAMCKTVENLATCMWILSRKSDVNRKQPFLGPAANVSVDSMGVSVTACEGPVKSGALWLLLSDAKKTAPL